MRLAFTLREKDQLSEHYKSNKTHYGPLFIEKSNSNSSSSNSSGISSNSNKNSNNNHNISSSSNKSGTSYSSIPEVIELMGDNNDDRFNSDTPIILVYPMEEEDMVSLASFLRLNNLFFPIIIIILSL